MIYFVNNLHFTHFIRFHLHLLLIHDLSHLLFVLYFSIAFDLLHLFKFSIYIPHNISGHYVSTNFTFKAFCQLHAPFTKKTLFLIFSCQISSRLFFQCCVCKSIYFFKLTKSTLFFNLIFTNQINHLTHYIRILITKKMRC